MMTFGKLHTFHKNWIFFGGIEEKPAFRVPRRCQVPGTKANNSAHLRGVPQASRRHEETASETPAVHSA
jgi:hypothetical protein